MTNTRILLIYAIRWLLLVPVWAMSRLISPCLPPTHPLKKPGALQMKNWFAYGTPLALQFGAVWWAMLLSWSAFIWVVCR